MWAQGDSRQYREEEERKKGGGEHERERKLALQPMRGCSVKSRDVEPEVRAGVGVCLTSSWLWLWKHEDSLGCQEPESWNKITLPRPLPRNIKEKMIKCTRF